MQSFAMFDVLNREGVHVDQTFSGQTCIHLPGDVFDVCFREQLKDFCWLYKLEFDNYYEQFGWAEFDTMDYIWPVK